MVIPYTIWTLDEGKSWSEINFTIKVIDYQPWIESTNE
jgi:hypothetical protein